MRRIALDLKTVIAKELAHPQLVCIQQQFLILCFMKP